jgi:hypothetical protein
MSVVEAAVLLLVCMAGCFDDGWMLLLLLLVEAAG